MIDSAEAARIIGRSRDTLARWRMEGRGPKPQGVIGRSLLYDKRECEEFAAALRKVSKPTLVA